MEAKLQKYSAIALSFEQFFNQEELGSLLDRKADIELIRRLQERKANREELSGFQGQLDECNRKLKHMSVFTQEVANIIVPAKQSGKFKNGNDLNNSLRKREQLVKYGNHMCNWIFTTTGADGGAISKNKAKVRYGSQVE